MKKVVIASLNPVKKQAVENGFQKMFPEEHFEIDGLQVNSGVKDQPLTDEETFQGAIARARTAREQVTNADYWVGIEGGIEDANQGMQAFAWVVVLSGDRMGKARTGSFYLPQKVADLIRGGMELGEADDIVFRRKNSKKEEGAIGILSGNVIDRTRLYEHGMVLALVPFRNKELYAENV